MPCALILMAETGGGHRSASIALKEAFEVLYPGEWDVHFIEIFAQILPFPLNRAGSIYRPMVAYTPFIWSTLWRMGEKPFVQEMVEICFSPFAKGALLRFLDYYRPELVISVHQLANHVPVGVFRKAGWDGAFVTVVTDLVTLHTLWFNPNVDLCIVPTEEAKTKAIKAGIPRQKVRLLGFPLSRRFRPAEDKEAIRRKLGLQGGITTGLLVGGGEGMGRLFKVACAINEATLPIQLLAVAGRNRSLRNRLESLNWNIPHKVYGFVDNMDQLMQASDFIITKAGPGTICEAMAVGLPILLIDFVPGQEEGNVEFVERQGVGVFAPSPSEAVRVLKRWLSHPQEIQDIRQRAPGLVKVEASLDIVAAAVEVVYNRQNKREKREKGEKDAVPLGVNSR